MCVFCFGIANSKMIGFANDIYIICFEGSSDLDQAGGGATLSVDVRCSRHVQALHRKVQLESLQYGRVLNCALCSSV